MKFFNNNFQRLKLKFFQRELLVHAIYAGCMRNCGRLLEIYEI
jgi:hypothetical protein